MRFIAAIALEDLGMELALPISGNLQILNLGMDTSTATGKLLLTMIGAIGQFEREMMLERQREGIAKADRKFADGRRPLVVLQIGFASCGRTECQPR